MDSLQILERYYNTFIDEEDARNFFIGLKDYIEYGDQIPEYDYITSLISSQGSPLFERYNEQTIIALEKVKEMHKKISSYIKKQNIKDENIEKSLREYDDFLHGRKHGNHPLVIFLHNNLSDVLQTLHELSDHKKFTENYVEYLRPDKMHVSKYLSLKEMDELYAIENEIEKGKKNEIWGAQYHIYGLYDVMCKGEKHYKDIQERYRKKDAKASFDILNYSVILGEWKHVIEGSLSRNPTFFDVKEIRPFAQRFHMYVVAHFEEARKNIGELLRIYMTKNIKSLKKDNMKLALN